MVYLNQIDINNNSSATIQKPSVIIGDILLDNILDKTGYISQNGKYSDLSSVSFKLIPVVPNTQYRIFSNEEEKSYVTFLSDELIYIVNQKQPLATGFIGVIELEANFETVLITPKDAKYLYVVNNDKTAGFFLPKTIRCELYQEQFNLLEADEQNDLNSEKTYIREIDINKGRKCYGYLNYSNIISYNYTYITSIIVPVSGNSTYKITVENSDINMGIMSTLYPENEIKYATNETLRVMNIGENYITTPKDAKSIIIVYQIHDKICLKKIEKQVNKNIVSSVDIVYNENYINLGECTKISGFLSEHNWNNDATVNSIIITVNSNTNYEINVVNSNINLGIMSTLDIPQNLTYAAGESLRVANIGTNLITTPADAECIVAVYNIDGTGICIDSCIEQPSYLNYEVYEGFFVDGFINKRGNILSSENRYKTTYFVPTFDYKKMNISMIRVNESESDTGLLFYDQNLSPLSEYMNPSYTNKNENNNYIEYINIFIPPTAKYFRITTWNDSYAEECNIDNRILYYFYSEEESKHITKGFILNEYVENAVKRAYQYTSIMWEPVADLPRESGLKTTHSIWPGIRYEDKFLANTKYTGVPYSFAGRGSFADAFSKFSMCVGHQVPFESFVTAARYEESFLFDKSTMGSFDYNAVAYGGDCVSLLTYAINWSYDSYAWNKIHNSDYVVGLGKVGAIDSSKLHPADLMQSSNHVLVITDVYYENKTSMIEVCELTTEGTANNNVIGTEVGGISFRKLYNGDEFDKWYVNYNVYRLKNFTKYNIEYIPLEFAPISKEEYRRFVPDMPLIPYMGNKFNYKFGYIPDYSKKILIGASGFVKLKVYKDGILFDEYDIDSETKSVNINFSEIGTYTAALYDSSNTSSAICTWYVKE